ELLITVSGRPAASLIPAKAKVWRKFEDIADLFPGPEDPDWKRDRDLIDQAIHDPWERRERREEY
ncbi:MAG: type II toxin-antitoxin system prevent-host-death family antitoxin, partial [Candidatus Dormibacteraceae bacterium]